MLQSRNLSARRARRSALSDLAYRLARGHLSDESAARRVRENRCRDCDVAEQDGRHLHIDIVLHLGELTFSRLHDPMKVKAMVSSYSAVSRAPRLAGTLVVATSLCLGTMSALADYMPPKLVPYDELVAATKEVMGRPSIPTTGADGWVEDLF